MRFPRPALSVFLFVVGVALGASIVSFINRDSSPSVESSAAVSMPADPSGMVFSATPRDPVSLSSAPTETNKDESSSDVSPLVIFVPIAGQETVCVAGDDPQEKQTRAQWEQILEKHYPDQPVYDLRAWCSLADGTVLVSYAYMGTDDAGQRVVRLKQTGGMWKLIQETPPEFMSKTAGDLSGADLQIESQDDVRVVFHSGDGPCMVQDAFHLDLQTFAYEHLAKTTDCGTYD